MWEILFLLFFQIYRVLSFDLVLISSYCISFVNFWDKFKEWLEVFSNLLILNLSWTIRSESHIDFRTQSVIMTLGCGGKGDGGGGMGRVGISLMALWSSEKWSNFKSHELPWTVKELCTRILRVPSSCPPIAHIKRWIL